jgi:hypothetical protein
VVSDLAAEKRTRLCCFKHDAPPTTAKSMFPNRNDCIAIDNACNDEAHAVSSDIDGPVNPNARDIVCAAT